MQKRKPVSIAIVEEDGKSFVVRRFAGGDEVREPVVPRKKTRRPKRPPLRVGSKQAKQ
jgi:uncharacterized protein GlcG (DUF336 family)